MKEPKPHLAARVGDHRGGPPRDIAPDRTPVTFTEEDGTIWLVVDLDTRVITAVRKLARRERVGVDELLSVAFVDQLTRWAESRGYAG